MIQDSNTAHAITFWGWLTNRILWAGPMSHQTWKMKVCAWMVVSGHSKLTQLSPGAAVEPACLWCLLATVAWGTGAQCTVAEHWHVCVRKFLCFHARLRAVLFLDHFLLFWTTVPKFVRAPTALLTCVTFLLVTDLWPTRQTTFWNGCIANVGRFTTSWTDLCLFCCRSFGATTVGTRKLWTFFAN